MILNIQLKIFWTSKSLDDFSFEFPEEKKKLLWHVDFFYRYFPSQNNNKLLSTMDYFLTQTDLLKRGNDRRGVAQVRNVVRRSALVV